MLPLLLLTWPAVVLADTNGMDMSMDGSMSLVMGNMTAYLHFTPGDMLWFMGWTPVSSGAMVGACIGLFLLAIIDRWIAACRSLMEAHWHRRMQLIVSNNLTALNESVDAEKRPSLVPSSSSEKALKDDGDFAVELTNSGTPPERMGTFRRRPRIRNTAPFIFSHDVVRGIVHAGQASLKFAFMLAVMTFQASFIISIVAGLGVGETIFGRYRAQAHLV